MDSGSEAGDDGRGGEEGESMERREASRSRDRVSMEGKMSTKDEMSGGEAREEGGEGTSSASSPPPPSPPQSVDDKTPDSIPITTAMPKNTTTTTDLESPPSPPPSPPKPPYFLLTKTQIRVLAVILGACTMFSPMTANVYLPCLPLLQTTFSTTTDLINLTVTGYVVMQAVAPMVFADVADKAGRRPVYVVTLGILVAASVGVGFLREGDYGGLVALRMVQSLGASVSTGLGYVVVSDAVAPSERGKVLAPVMLLANVGPVVAPLVGGQLCFFAGWRWIFWFLAIASGVLWGVVVCFLPETNRRIVGNGSVRPRGLLNRPVLSALMPRVERFEDPPPIKPGVTRLERILALVPNPLRAARMLLIPDTAPVLLLAGLYYGLYYVLQASLPDLFAAAYGYDESAIGLCYLSMSVGVIVGSLANARVMDWNYKATAKEVGWGDVDALAGDDLDAFPIERARARYAWLFQGMGSALAVAYGWTIHFRVHPAVPLILLFFQSCCGFTQTWNTLAVEMHHGGAKSSASAAANISRGLMSALWVGVQAPLMRALGVGGFFTLLGGGMAVVGTAAVAVVRVKCPGWREKRRRREREGERKREERDVEEKERERVEEEKRGLEEREKKMSG